MLTTIAESATTSHETSADPLMALRPFPYRKLFHPLGFNVEIETNSPEVLEAAEESWSDQVALGNSTVPILRLRLGVTFCVESVCPPDPSVRAHGHLLSILADQENFAFCDLLRGQAFGWISQAALDHRSYMRYHFLEAVVFCLLSGTHVTPLHGACVSRNGCGLLLCGESGAGKSTLAYACARAGWTLTSDDASYLLWNRPSPRVRGNASQLRFRPSARELFPEFAGRSLTPRIAGKPSIEIRTAELPHITVSTEASVHAIVRLRRHESSSVQLIALAPDAILPYFEDSLFPLNGIHEPQVEALNSLIGRPLYEIRYRDLDTAIAHLEQLTEEVTKR